MNQHEFNLKGRAKGSPVYPKFVLLGQFTTEEEKSNLISRMGKRYTEFQVEPVVNDRTND